MFGQNKNKFLIKIGITVNFTAIGKDLENGLELKSNFTDEPKWYQDEHFTEGLAKPLLKTFLIHWIPNNSADIYYHKLCNSFSHVLSGRFVMPKRVNHPYAKLLKLDNRPYDERFDESKLNVIEWSNSNNYLSVMVNEKMIGAAPKDLFYELQSKGDINHLKLSRNGRLVSIDEVKMWEHAGPLPSFSYRNKYINIYAECDYNESVSRLGHPVDYEWILEDE